MSRGWSGRKVTTARAVWAARIAAAGGWPCCRCGRVIVPGSAWQVDHWPVPREFGGTETAPAHARCNLAAGGRRGAAITNGRRRAAEVVDQRLVQW